MDAIYAVINGIDEVLTMQSGMLVMVHLACALLAHFASQVRTLSILRLGPFPSAQVGHKFPTFAPYLHTSFSVFNGVH